MHKYHHSTKSRQVVTRY